MAKDIVKDKVNKKFGIIKIILYYCPNDILIKWKKRIKIYLEVR